MDLKTLHEACGRLLEQQVSGEEPIGFEVDGRCYEITSLSVCVSSDLWVDNTVLLQAREIEEDTT